MREAFVMAIIYRPTAILRGDQRLKIGGVYVGQVLCHVVRPVAGVAMNNGINTSLVLCQHTIAVLRDFISRPSWRSFPRC